MAFQIGEAAMIRHILLGSALLAASASAPAQKQAAAPVPALDPDAERAALDFSASRGQLLFGLDRAAWVATDDLAERLPDWRDQGVRGYIVERSGEGFAVTFFGGPEAAPVALYRGQVRDNRVVSREIFPAAARPALSADQRRLASARAAAAAAVRGRPCGNAPFNSAVVPPEAPGGPIDVYLLTPQVANRQYPLGGHYKLTVDAGGRASGERAFMRSCMTFDAAAPTDGARGATVAAIMVTHLLDPVPTEIHVFTSLTSGLPVFVMAGDVLWSVEGAAIRQVTRQEPRRRRRRN
jgi:hypothetical protein